MSTPNIPTDGADHISGGVGLTYAILQTVLDGVITIDHAGTIQSVNPAVERLFGYRENETVGQNVAMLMPSSVGAKHGHYLRRYLETGQARIVGIGREVQGRRKDGSIFPLHLGISEAEYEGKQLFVGIMRDLSAQRAAEEQRDRFFSATPDLLCTVRTDGRFGLLNPAWQKCVGFTPDELRAEPLTSFLHPDDPPLLITADNWDNRANSASVECRIRCKDGTYKWMEWLITPADGENLIFAAARDITERKEIDRLKSEFVSTVSHELRTPLTSIRGSLGLLEGGSAVIDAAKSAELIRIARENTDRLIRLINDVLDLEKIESGKLELNQRRLSVSELVAEAASNVAGMAAQAQVQIATHTGRHSVFADHDRAIQVLVNLLGNAIKFSAAQSTVELSASADDHIIRFEVRDTGPGIPPEHQARLFNKFEQIDNSDRRSKGGSGLGLAIAKAIVEQHGGTIGVTSRPGEGSTFHFTLARAVSTGSGTGPLDETLTERRRLLVVEDNADVAQVLRTLLEAQGYEVLSAPSVAQAKQLVNSFPPEVVVLDIGLPDGSGLDLWQWLRQHESAAHVPVVVITGGAEQQGIDSLGGPQLAHWLIKPFSNEALLQAIRCAVHEPGAPALVLVVEDDDATRKVVSEQICDLGAECVAADSGTRAIDLLADRSPDLIVLDVNIDDINGFELVEHFRRGKTRTTPLVVYTSRDLSAVEKRQLTLGMTRHLVKSRSKQEEFVSAVRDLLAGLLPTDDDPGTRGGQL